MCVQPGAVAKAGSAMTQRASGIKNASQVQLSPFAAGNDPEIARDTRTGPTATQPTADEREVSVDGSPADHHA